MAQLSITVIDKATHTSKVVTGQEVTLSAHSVIELPLSHSQVKTLARSGTDLVITTADGETVVIHGFFADAQGAAGHSDLVLQDAGGLWLADLSDMNALPMDTAVDPGSSNVFSSIDSADPLLAGTSPVATAAPEAPTPAETPAPAETATPATASADTTAGAADAAGAGAGGAADQAAPVGDAGMISWLPLLGGVGIIAGAAASKSGGSGTATPPPSDTTPPAQQPAAQQAEISSVSQNDKGNLIVTGHGTAGDVVKVTFPDNSSVTATVNADGTYTATSSGTYLHTGTVTVIDTTNSTTAATSNWNEPTAPAVSSVATNADDGGITVTGTATPGDTVTVTFPDGTTATVTAGSDGTYSVTTHTAQAESGSVSVTSTDATTGVSSPTTFKYADTTPPHTPTADVTADGDGGLTVHGGAEAGSTVVVTFPDSSTAVTTADSSGNYSVTTHTPQSSGTYTVTATDAAGNVSQPLSQTYTDSTAPQAPAVGIAVDSDGGITVQGSAEAGSTVTVTFPDTTTAVTMADASGHYSVTPQTAVQASGTVSVTATDAAGNASTVTSVPYTAGTALSYVSVSYVTANADGGLTVVGNASEGSNVSVKYPDGSTGSVEADATGHYSITTHTPQTSGTVQAMVISDSTTLLVSGMTYTDTTPPQAPAAGVTVNADGGITVAGNAEAGSIITVTYPDGSSGSVQADANGNYTLTTHATQASGEVVVTATDAAGHASAATDVSYTAGTSQPAFVSVTSVNANADGGITVLGHASAGGTVTITLPDGSSVTTTAEDNAQYSFTTSAVQPSGEVSAVTVDTSGHTSSTATAAYTDTDAVTIAAISPDAGNSADFITNTGALQVSGTLEHVLVSAHGLAETLQINMDVGGSGKWNAATSVDGTNWSYDTSASPLADGVHVVGAQVLDANNHVVSSSTQEVVVSSNGSLSLSLKDVLSDTAALGNGQHVTIGESGSVVTSVTLTDGVGTGANQWENTGSTTIGGITYDVYHNTSQTTTAADLLLQHGITVH